MAASNRKVAVLVTCWVVGLAGAFWHLEWQYLRPVRRPNGAAQAHPERQPLAPLPELASDRGILLLSGAQPITLLNFWNPDCLCSRYNERHAGQLAESTAPRGVRAVTVVECGDSESEKQAALAAWRARGYTVFAVVADPGGKSARAFGVWAAPAAVILNGQSRVVYVGAYNAARYCDNARTAWAAQALDATLNGRPPHRATSPFFGCQVIAARK